jgi:glutaminyl-peptide cyclotransferase
MGYRSAVLLRSALSWLVLGWTLTLVISCKPVTLGSGQASASPSPATTQTPPLPPRRETIWKDFDSQRSLASAQTILSYGNRIAASDALDKVRAYLKNDLVSAGWEVTDQQFSEQAAGGQVIHFSSLLGRFAKVPPAKPSYLLAAHFDSPNLGLTVDPGATDGAANTAVLLEIARTLSLDPRLAAHVQVLFLDGHMPFHQISPSDGLFGSRFYTQILKINQTTDATNAVVVLEHLGGYGSPLGFAPNSDPALIERFRSAAQALKIDLEAGKRPFLLDHVPFQNAGIAAIALLDPDAAYLHTADDDASRLSRDAFAQAGQLVLYFLSEQDTPPASTPGETILSDKGPPRTRGKN